MDKLTKLNLTSVTQANVAAYNIAEQASNNGKVVETLVQSKFLIKVCEKLKEKLEDEVVEEVGKHGKSLVQQDTKIEVRSSTSWDFEPCQDVYLQELEQQLKEIKTAISLRKTYLKGVKDKRQEPHPETGEIYDIYPPHMKSKEIPFITLNKI